MSVKTKEDILALKYSGKDGKEKKIGDTLSQDDVWITDSGVGIIGLRGIKKLMFIEKVVEKDFRTEIVPTENNKQQHAVNIWVGFAGDMDKDNWVRGSGEASVLNTGKVTRNGDKRLYDEYGSVDSKYRFAMADKRALCRAVLNLLGIFEVYSEAEAAEFSMPNNIKNHDY